MALDTISRAEFDKRLDAANARREQELQIIEAQQTQANQLLSYYERTLGEIETELNKADTAAPLSARLRQRLNELAERTAQVADLV